MQALIRNAVALSNVGEYDFTGSQGEKYRYVDLYDGERGEIVRLSLSADCTPPANVEFGTKVDLWCEILSNEKIVRGEDRDRSMKSLKLRAVSIELSKATTNGRADAPKPLPAAA